MPSSTQYSVVVPAAGVGKRMQTACPKQYLKIAGSSIIEHSIENLLAHPNIGQVVVVLNPNDTYFATLPIATHPSVKTVLGGKERCDSVLAGLNFLPDNDQWILVHDAARPCLLQSDLSKLLQLAEQGNVGGILASPVRDTMKRAKSDSSTTERSVKQTVSRKNLWHALTPQFFKLGLLKKALNHTANQGIPITDEASAMEHIGEEVVLVEGQASNIKVTQPEDLLLAEFYLTQKQSTQGA